MSLREDQKVSGFVYIFRNMDPTWINRIKVGLSVDPYARTQQLFTTGVPFQYWVYHAWAVTNMALAEAIAHNVLNDQRLANNREHFDIIPMHRREGLFGVFTVTNPAYNICGNNYNNVAEALLAARVVIEEGKIIDAIQIKSNKGRRSSQYILKMI